MLEEDPITFIRNIGANPFLHIIRLIYRHILTGIVKKVILVFALKPLEKSLSGL